MKTKRVIIDAQSLIRIFVDYCKREDLPADSVALKLFVKPAEKKFGILITSREFKEDLPPVQVEFDIKRVFGVGDA